VVTPEKTDKQEKVPRVDKGKKIEHFQKQSSQGWQSKDNPSGIGSSKAFEAPTQVVNPPHHQKEVHTVSIVSHGTDSAEGQTERENIDVHVTHNEQSAYHIDV
jgi:hypothetical protein